VIGSVGVGLEGEFDAGGDAGTGGDTTGGLVVPTLLLLVIRDRKYQDEITR
jgi:hypothetical protein